MADQNQPSVFTRNNMLCGGGLIGTAFLAAFLYPGLGGLSIWSSIIALGVGGLLWVGLHFIKSDYRMTFIEASIASIILLAVVVPVTDHFGSEAAINDQLSYNEYWGGYETQANSYVQTCEKDGSCRYTYACDWYWVKVVDEEAHTDPAYTDSNKVYHPAVYHPEVSHQEHRHHDCPYVTEEYTYKVATTLGDYTIYRGSGDYPEFMPANPQAHRWHGDDGGDYEYSVPNYPQGVPQFWLDARARINSGNPGPVTAQRSYDNYILASQDETLKKFSPEIKSYKDAGLLPKLVTGIHDYYYLDRAYFVGVNAGDRAAWQGAMDRFNAAFGASLQGDLYLVVIDANKVSDPQIYIQTLTAYWQSKELGKGAISKNAVVIVLGTKDGGKTVAWARAQTGMPTGNSTLIFGVQNNVAAGTPLTPSALLGSPTASVNAANNKYKVVINHTAPTPGVLESILWDSQTGFKRVCMTCKTPGDSGVGFTYLRTQIQPTGGQMFGILSILTVLSIIVWCICVFGAVPISRAVTGHDPYGVRTRNFRNFR